MVTSDKESGLWGGYAGISSGTCPISEAIRIDYASIRLWPWAAVGEKMAHKANGEITGKLILLRNNWM